MLSFFGRSTKGKPVVVADVEGSSAAVAVALLHHAAPAEIIVGERQSVPTSLGAATDAAAGIPSILNEVSERILKKYAEQDGIKKHGTPKSVHVFLGSPWSEGRTAHAVAEFPEPRHITKQMIQSLAQEAIRQPSELKRHILETNVVRVHVNGYPTGKPIGKRGTSLAVTVYESDADPLVMQNVESTLAAQFPGRSVDIRSQIRALMSTLSEHAYERNYVILLVGTETTECVAVRKDEIAEHTSVPEGLYTIIRRIAGEKGLPEEKLSLLRMLATDTCSAAECEAMKANLAKAEPELVKIFGEAFGTLVSVRRLPNPCVLLAHADISPWLEHFFSRLDFSQFTMTTQPFRVWTMTAAHTQDFATWNAGRGEETGIGIAAAFLNLGM